MRSPPNATPTATCRRSTESHASAPRTTRPLVIVVSIVFESTPNAVNSVLPNDPSESIGVMSPSAAAWPVSDEIASAP